MVNNKHINDLKKLLNKFSIIDLVMIDVGAKDNIEYISELKELIHLHAFEPNNLECNVLKEKFNIQKFKHVVINNFGLAQKTQNYKFNLTKHAAMSSLLEVDLENYEKNFGTYLEFDTWKKAVVKLDETSIKCMSLDDYTNNGNYEIDYLKLDTQGTELNILRGAENLLKQKKIHIIKVEVPIVLIYKNQPFFSDIDIYLRNHDFEMVDLIRHKNNANKANSWRHAPCGDAIYILNTINISNSRCIKNATILSWLGYNSLAVHYLKKMNLSQHEISLFTKLKAYKRECVIKRFFKAWTKYYKSFAYHA